MAQDYFQGPHGRLANEQIDGEGPGIVWLGGFRSDMTGTKASFLADWARDNNRAFLRFDYSGHGASDGKFEDGAISDWAADARSAIAALTSGPQILVGSSMGAWITCLLVRDQPALAHALVLIAPAPDFTEDLMWPDMPEADRETLMQTGRLESPSPYDDEPTIITKRLIEDGRDNLVLRAPIPFTGPVRILQGMADEDVPWPHAAKVAEALASDDVTINFSKTGDHRLSTPADLSRLTETISRL